MSEGLTRLGPGSYRSHTPDATTALGELLGGVLQEGDAVILEGDLGAGKTQLAKGVALALGVGGEVTSPTFTLLMAHEGSRLTLFHLDLYRLEDAGELGDAGALDVVGSEGVSLVEWGGPYGELLAPERLELTLTRCVFDARAGGEAQVASAEQWWAGERDQLAPAPLPSQAGEPDRLISAQGYGAGGEALARAFDAAVAHALAR